MKKILFPVLVGMIITLPLISQAQKANYTSTLFTIGDESVTLGKFDSVYRKNNTGKDLDYSKKALYEYDTLYINFRLKVKEARTLRMDTLPSVISELSSYRSQLAKNYMQDTAIEHKLVIEAYNRMKTDVHVMHILIKVDQNASPADTLTAFNKIKDIRDRVMKGEDFSSVAQQVSQDPSVKDNKGDLGWITALQVVYPFENVAYTTPVGQVSQIFRTQYGYHIVKVLDTRQDRGQVQVEHIFVRLQPNASDVEKAKQKAKIDSAYALLQKGKPWADLVREFSDDKSTVNDTGKLPMFGAGKMVEEFETAAFALKNPGDISQPVRSPYGWHIIKLLQKKPVSSFDEVKDNLKKQIDHDQRSTVASAAFLNDIKIEYHFKELPQAKQELLGKIDTTIKKGGWKASEASNLKSPLFTLTVLDKSGKSVIKTQSYTQADFASYIEGNQRRYTYLNSPPAIFEKLYEQFVNASLLSFEQSRLEDKYPAFRDLMHEYQDGILLFELTDKMVWSKAVKDSAGLVTFYNANKNKYMGNPKVKAVFYNCMNATVAEGVQSLLNNKASDKDITDKINTKDQPNNIKVETGSYEKGQNSTLDSLGWKAGVYTLKEKNGSVEIVKVTDVLAPAPKTLEEAKGYVVADYQEYLEKQWIASLRVKYPVKQNIDVLNTLVKSN